MATPNRNPIASARHPAPRVTVVVATRGRVDAARAILGHLSEVGAGEVVLASAGPVPADLLEAFPDLLVIEKAEDVGYPQLRAAGAGCAEGDFVAFVDDRSTHALPRIDALFERQR